MRVHSGIDLVSVARVAALDSDTLERVFSATELQQSRGRAESLAGRWAAKEAALKVLGRGVDTVPLASVEVVASPSGAPTLELSGVALESALERGLTELSVSISHDGGFAVAMVVALAEDRPVGR